MMDTFVTKIHKDIVTKMDTTVEERRWFARLLALLQMHHLPNEGCSTNKYIYHNLLLDLTSNVYLMSSNVLICNYVEFGTSITIF